MASIDIGAAAIDRNSSFTSTYTILAVDNPANDTGILNTFEIWAQDALGSCKVGTFSGSGTSYDDRDYETIGDVPSGSKQIFSGLDCDVVTGDYIGIYFATGWLERVQTGFAGIYVKSGDQFGAGVQTYSSSAADTISLYGTGFITYDEKGRSQTILATVAKGEQLIIGETEREQTVLGVVSESDLATFLDTLKSQTILAAQAKADLHTINETAKVQTILAAISGGAYSKYIETLREQVVLATIGKGEQLTMVETYRSRPDQRYYVPLTIDHDLVGITQVLASNASSGQKDVVVQKGSVYGVGDSVVIKDSENRETGTVASVAGNTVTLEDNLTNSYTTANGAWLKNVTDSTDQTDFPVYFNEHDMPATFWTRVKADGTDIAVYTPTGVKLKRELVAGSWDRSGHTMELHVRVPIASTTVDTIVQLCYGYAAGAETNDTEVWDTHYKAVYHMNDDPDTSHIKDSTVYGNDGTKKAANEPVEAAGSVGKAQDFDDTNLEHVDCGSSDSLKPTSFVTVESVFSVPDLTGNHTLVSKNGYSFRRHNYHLYLESGTTIRFRVVNNTGDEKGVYLPGTLTSTGVHYLVGRYDGQYVKAYLDGSEIGSKDVGAFTIGTSDYSLFLGKHYYNGAYVYYLKGLEDEARISDIHRPPGHISTTNNTLVHPSIFYSVGAEVDREMVILAKVEESDLATFLEAAKTQTILAVVTESDLATFLETSKEQIVLVLQSESDAYVFVETGKAQTILTIIGEADTFLKYLAALKYVLELHNSDGDLVAILQNASDIGYAQMINSPHSLSFSIPADDSKASNITLANEVWLRNQTTGMVIKRFRLSHERDSRV